MASRSRRATTAHVDTSVERVVVVGLGYVGLPAALSLARAGYHVTGADIDRATVTKLQGGRSPVETVPNDDVRAAVAGGRFEATTDTTGAVRAADFVIVCVPTPVDDEHKPDLTPLRLASRAIGQGLRPGCVVSYESTTFPGCTERECIPILEAESGLRAGEDFGVAYCPERINPGDALHTTEITPRVLGALDDGRSLEVARSVYESILTVPLHLCKDIRTAEAAKVLENIQRDVNIALVNEFAMLCPRLGLDAHEVLDAAGTKFNFMRVHPGPGVGGHCIPVDPHYLIDEARRAGFEPRLMATARAVNEDATRAITEATLGALAAPASDKKVAVLGLSYKGGVGDVRESPAIHIVDALRPAVRALSVHDPHVEAALVKRAARVPAQALEEAVRDAAAIAIVTDHPEFRVLDWKRLASLAAPGAMVIDARNVASPKAVRDAGLRYWGLGRGSA